MEFINQSFVYSPASVFSPAPIEMVVEKKLETIFTIDKLEKIATSQPEGTIYLFDVDETVYHHLGLSKEFRVHFLNATKEMKDSKELHDKITYLLAQNYPIKTVEEGEKGTSQFIKDLQDNGYVVCGLTARERNRWYDMSAIGVDKLTTEQLQSMNVYFNSNERLEFFYSRLADDSEYYLGTFYANFDTKGDYLKKLFELAKIFPIKIVFIDDKKSQCESVDKALTELNIDHECYYYTAAVNKKFNPLIANIQLFYFCMSKGQEYVSEEEAALIAKNNPEYDAEFYLQTAVEFAREIEVSN